MDFSVCGGVKKGMVAVICWLRISLFFYGIALILLIIVQRSGLEIRFL